MSRRYAKAAVAALNLDVAIKAWATGGILDRDPRRSGPNATGAVFATTPDGDIKPTIAVVGTTGTPGLTRIPNAWEDSIDVRIFAPDHTSQLDKLDEMAERIKYLLNGYRASNELPGIFRFEFRQGIQNGGAFEDVAYDEVRFNVASVSSQYGE